MYFYACVPLYRLLGESFRGIALTALAINVAALVGVLLLVSRAGAGALLAAALALSLFIADRGPSWAYSAWNPSVVVLPFGFALTAFAAFAAGDRTLPLAVVACSFAAQTHLGCVPVLAVVGLVSLLARVSWIGRALGLPAPPPDDRARASAVLGLALGALLWTPVLVEQLSPGEGNLSRIVAFAGRSGGEHDLRETSLAVAQNTVGFVGARGFAVLALAALVAAVVVAHLIARRRSGFVAALSATDLLGLAVASVAASRVVGPLLSYLVRWMGMLGVAGAAAVGGALPLLATRASRGFRRAACGIALVALVAVAAFNGRLAWRMLAETPEPAADSEAAGRLAAQVAPALAREGVLRPLVEVRPGTSRDIALGFLLALDKRSVSWAVEPFGPFHLGGRWTPSGTEDATLVLGAEGAAAGGRLLAHEAGQFVYLLPRGTTSAPPL